MTLPLLTVAPTDSDVLPNGGRAATCTFQHRPLRSARSTPLLSQIDESGGASRDKDEDLLSAFPFPSEVEVGISGTEEDDILEYEKRYLVSYSLYVTPQS